MTGLEDAAPGPDGYIPIGPYSGIVLLSTDPVCNGVVSGVETTYYLIDREPAACEGTPRDTNTLHGTCANPLYAGPFSLSPGTHTIYYISVDNAGNEENLGSALIYVEGEGTLSGVISTPGLPAGSTVTVVVSTDYFHNEAFTAFTFVAQDPAFDYTLTLPAFAAYYVLAFAGVPEDGPLPGASIGVFDNYAPVYIASGAAVSGINFQIAPDAQPPFAAITSIAEGSAITGLSALSGTAADNIGVDYLEAAVQDITTGLWWSAQGGIWVSTSVVLPFDYADADFQGRLSAPAWTIRIDTGAYNTFDMLFSRLAIGHEYRIYLRAEDFSGNTQQTTSTVGFIWDGPQGDIIPHPVSDLSGSALGISSISWTWQADTHTIVSGYAVYSDPGVFLSSVTAPLFISTGLAPNFPFSIWVAAYNAYGESIRNRAAEVYTLAAVPGKPVVLNVTDTSITAQWSQAGNPGGTWYELRGSTNNFETMLSTTVIFRWDSTGDVFVTIPDLEPETIYYAKVRAINGDQLPTGYSAAASTKTLVAFPKPPVNPAAFIMEGGKIMFSWNIPSGQAPSIYSVYRSSAAEELAGGGIPDPLLQISSNNAVTSIIDSPGASGLFYYAATAFNRLGQESPLSEVVPVLLDLGSPYAEIIFSSPAASLGVGDHPFSLLVSELLAFPPILTITPGGQSPVLLRLQPETPVIWKGTFTVTRQTNSGEALFAFSGEDLAGNTGAWIKTGGAARVDTEAPYAYGILSAASISHGSLAVRLLLNERPVSTPTLSFVTAAHGATPVALAADSAEELSWAGGITIPAGFGDGPAMLEFSASDAVGNTGTLLSGATFFIIDNTPPGIPGAFSAAAMQAGAVRLVWGRPASEIPAGYAVYRDEVLVSSPVSCAEPDGGAYFTDTPGDGAYAYSISAIDAAGNEGARTAAINVTADSSSPQPPMDLRVSVDAAEQVFAIWQPPSQEALSYRVYRSTVQGMQLSTVPVIETPDAFAAEKPVSDGDYYYVVTALDAAGNESAPSGERAVLYDKAAPVITIAGVEDGKAYPSAVFPVYGALDSNLAEGSVAAALNGAPFNSGGLVEAEGGYTLTVSASDTEGHSTIKTQNFAIDKTSPAITISGVAGGLVYHSSVSIQVSCSDLRLHSTSYLLNGESYTPGTMISKDGSYTFTAEAIDKAGNTTTASLNFSLDSPPPAPAKVRVEARSEGGAALSWEKPEGDVVGYRVYRDGIRISASLTPSTAFYDAAFSNYSAHTYEVCAIDAAGQEGARASVIVPYISATLQGYGGAVNGTEALNRGFFDSVRPAFTNSGSGALALGAVYLDITASGADVVRSTVPAANIPGGTSAVLSGVVNTDPRWPGSVTLKVSAVLPAAPGTEAVFTRGFILSVRNPIEPVLEISHQPFVLGADAAVRLKFNNRGSAPLDIETARIRANQPVEGGMVSLELRTGGGMLLAKKGLMQLSGGVMAAMLDSTLPGDGIPEKELTYYASIPAGSSFLFEPVTLPVPASVADKLLLSASVSRSAFDLSSSAVTGLGSFQLMLEEASVSSAPYSVSVLPEHPIYDQNISIILSGQARDSLGALLPGTSVQVEISGRGYARVLSGVTDNQGDYNVIFNPMPEEAGIYTLAAFPPEAVNHAIQSTFSITGFAFEPASYSGTMSQNSAMDLAVSLKNTGEKPLTGLSWQIEVLSGAGVALSLTGMPSTLEAGTKASLNLKAQATADASSPAELKLTVTDINGFTRSFPISLSIVQAMPIPSATPAQFETGLLAGETKQQTILLQNKGFNTWTDVSASIAPALASWVKVQGSSLLGDIAPGGSASLVLNIAPPEYFPSGTYADINMVELRSGNAGTLAINGAITVTTTRKGAASFTVVNGDVVIGDPAEFISGAEVTVKSMDVPEISFISLTGADGKALFADIPAGNYTYKAGYAGFQEVTGRFTVDPGVTRAIEAVLVTNMVTYSWSVTPTAIQDYYEIKLDMTLNTSVDAPKVVAEPAFILLNEPAGKTIYTQYTLTNQGRISVFNVEVINSGEDSGITVETPFTTIPELKAGQSIVVPLKIYIAHNSPCKYIGYYVKYLYRCGRGTWYEGLVEVFRVLSGGPEKTCNGPGGPGTDGGGGEGCSYEPKIKGPDTLGPSATTYIISPDPSENKCPSCEHRKCSDFVWSATGDVKFASVKQGCSIKAYAPNRLGGSLTATYANTKQINGCKIDALSVAPSFASVFAEQKLQFSAIPDKPDCAFKPAWTRSPSSLGTVSPEAGVSTTFEALWPGDVVLTAKDTYNAESTPGTANIEVNCSAGDIVAIPDHDKNGEVILPIGETAKFKTAGQLPKTGGDPQWTATGGTLGWAGEYRTLTNMTPGKYTVTVTLTYGSKTCSTSIPVAFVKVVAARSMEPGAIFSGEKVAFAVTTVPVGDAYLKLVEWTPVMAEPPEFPPPSKTTMKEVSKEGGVITIQFNKGGHLRMLFKTGASDTGATSGNVEVIGFELE